MSKITNKTSIAILMATYNGEKYMREQIDSILCQTNQDWTLYIQDDGSKDLTLDIIKSYDDERIVLVDVGLTRQGGCLNFMSLLNMVDSDYYMFCDQDDVWFDNKVELSYQRMREIECKSEKNMPIIVHTDRTYTDNQLNVRLKSEFNPRGLSIDKVKIKIDKLKDSNILAIYTIVSGCTMFMNKNVKTVVMPFFNIRYHDVVCAMGVANSGGVIESILEPTMYYRLHSSNTCGVSDSRLFPKLVHFIDTIKRNMRGYYLWKLYGKGSFFKFLYYRIKYFLILRLY